MFKKLVCLVFLVFFIVACGPKPGTPEYVLGKLEEGLVVGPKNLVLLTEDHLDPMIETLNNPKVPSVGQEQIAQRLTGFKLPDVPGTLGPLLDHPNPEVRRLVARRLSVVVTPQVARLLIERLEKESPEIIRITIAKAIQQIGLHLETLDPEIVQYLLNSLEQAPEKNKLEYVVALSGWPTKEAIKKVFDHVGSSNNARAEAASSGLLSLSQTHIEEVAPLTPAMLAHRIPSVRRNGLRIVYYQLSGRGKEEKCSESLVSVLEKTAPSLRNTLEILKTKNNVDSSEKQLISEILGCMNASAGGDQPGQNAPNSGQLNVTNTGS